MIDSSRFLLFVLSIVNTVLGYRLSRHQIFTNSSQLWTTKSTGSNHQESSQTLYTSGDRLRKEIEDSYDYCGPTYRSFISFKNAGLVGDSALRTFKRKATPSCLHAFFRKEITTIKPLILLTFGKELRGARSLPESDRVGKHSERSTTYPAFL